MILSEAYDEAQLPSETYLASAYLPDCIFHFFQILDFELCPSSLRKKDD